MITTPLGRQHQRGPQTQNCPNCGEDILVEATQCIHCGHRLSDPSRMPSGSFSYAQPLRSFVFLSIITFTAYNVYWFLKTWRQLQEHLLLDTSPFWRTAGLCVPILNLFLIYTLIRDVRNYAEIEGVEVGYPPVWIFLSLVAFFFLGELPTPYAFVFFGYFIPLAFVQRGLNTYWEAAQPGLVMKKAFTTGEKIFIVIGGSFWVLLAISLSLWPLVP